MTFPEKSSIDWFVSHMRLHNHGVIPTVTPTELMPSREQLAQFMGPKHKSGFTFENHGCAEYEDYVRDLFVRVQQTNWPINHVLPFHFARGLLSECFGMEVNWAEYAFKVTHPYQSRTGIPRLLPVFDNLEAPLHPLKKVFPETYYDEGEDTLHVVTNQAQEQNTAAEPKPNVTLRTRTTRAGKAEVSPCPHSADALPPKFKNMKVSDNKANLETGGSCSREIPKALEVDGQNPDISLDNIVSALSALRPGIIPLVESEHRKLQETRHNAYAAVSKLKTRLREEKERAALISRRVEERMATHARAVQEYERARRVLVASMVEADSNACVQGKQPHSNIIRNCEALVNSWYDNVREARQRLEEWQLKSERHGIFLERLKGELSQAENDYSSTCEALDAKVAHLRAITELLQHSQE